MQFRVLQYLLPHFHRQPQSEPLGVLTRLDQRMPGRMRPREPARPGRPRPSRAVPVQRLVQQNHLRLLRFRDLLFWHRLNGVVLRLDVFRLGDRNRDSVNRLVRLRDEVSSTNRAGGVRGEPLVDALRVKHVVTLWDQTQRFGFLELVEANGAFESPFSNLVNLHHRILESGEGFNNCRIEATCRPTRTSSGAELAAGLRGRIGAVADVDGEEAHEEKRGYEDHDYDSQGGAESFVIIRVV